MYGFDCGLWAICHTYILHVQTFSGNTDTDSVVQHKLLHSIRTRFLRFLPLEGTPTGGIGLRLEIYGCSYSKRHTWSHTLECATQSHKCHYLQHLLYLEYQHSGSNMCHMAMYQTFTGMLCMSGSAPTYFNQANLHYAIWIRSICNKLFFLTYWALPTSYIKMLLSFSQEVVE